MDKIFTFYSKSNSRLVISIVADNKDDAIQELFEHFEDNGYDDLITLDHLSFPKILTREEALTIRNVIVGKSITQKSKLIFNS